MKPIISFYPSADFAYLAKDIEMINRSEADWVHIDIMDGSYLLTEHIRFWPSGTEICS